MVNGSAPQFVINTTPCTVGIGVPPANCTGPSSDPRVLAHVDGYVVVPCYLNAAGCPPGSRFQYLTPSDVTPAPIPGNVYDAHFECNIPIGAAQGETFRVAMVGHGLFGTADEINSDKYYNVGQHGMVSCAIGISFGIAPDENLDLSRLPQPQNSVRQLESFRSLLELSRSWRYRAAARLCSPRGSPAFKPLVQNVTVTNSVELRCSQQLRTDTLITLQKTPSVPTLMRQFSWF